MARDLKTLKEVLWTQFETAVNRQREYADPYKTNTYGDGYNIAVAGRTAIGTLAQAIVAVEAEQRACEEAQSRLPSPIKKPAVG